MFRIKPFAEFTSPAAVSWKTYNIYRYKHFRLSRNQTQHVKNQRKNEKILFFPTRVSHDANYYYYYTMRWKNGSAVFYFYFFFFGLILFMYLHFWRVFSEEVRNTHTHASPWIPHALLHHYRALFKNFIFRRIFETEHTSYFLLLFEIGHPSNVRVLYVGTSTHNNIKKKTYQYLYIFIFGSSVPCNNARIIYERMSTNSKPQCVLLSTIIHTHTHTLDTWKSGIYIYVFIYRERVKPTSRGHGPVITFSVNTNNLYRTRILEDFGGFFLWSSKT